MTRAVLDDHLLRDLMAGRGNAPLTRLLRRFEPATTNLYLYRLTRAVVGARGGALTGAWPEEFRRALGARLLELPDDVSILPMAMVTYRMAEIASAHPVSTLGAEAVAAAEALGGPLCVVPDDDGPGVRAAARSSGVRYRVLTPN